MISAIEWLQKLMSNKQGRGWRDLQTVTHFRNASRGEVLKWYNALPLLDVDLNWVDVKTQFEKDFRATPTNSSGIQKLPEIKQKVDESVIQGVSRCTEILLELKTKTNVPNLNMHLQLPAEETEAYITA
jgi:hypothetical protein